MDGLSLKATALSWCREAFPYGGAHEQELDERDQRLVHQLIEGLTESRARRGHHLIALTDEEMGAPATTACV
jgi:hypothetical protein